jgi:NifU-like protein involved in Fe-S cluster formation
VSYFSETLLDHARYPRNCGEIESPAAVGEASLNGRAPKIIIYLKIVDGIIAHARFRAFGCGVIIACCSLLTELVSGQAMSAAGAFVATDLIAGLEGIPGEKEFCAQMAIDALTVRLGKAIGCPAVSVGPA